MIKLTSICNEVWLDIKDYEGYYQVSNLGRIRSLDREIKHSKNHTRFIKGKILSLRENKSRAGYLEVSLHKNKKEKRFRVHRLVAEAFLNNENNFPQVNHIDGDKSNNTIWNLEWVTDLQNKKHAWENGLYSSNHRKREIECIETGKIYESVQKASELIPCDRKYLFKHLKGEVKSVKGLTYKYRRGVNKELEEYRGGINE